MKYNPTTYFADHTKLLKEWELTTNVSTADQLEAEIEQLSMAHMKYILKNQKDLNECV